MQTYAALAAEHIQAAEIPRGWRYLSARAAAPKLHAMVFGIVEKKSEVILSAIVSSAMSGGPMLGFDREDIKALALAQAVYMRDNRQLGFIGGFIATAILSWLVGKLVDLAINWLIARMEEWIGRNKVTGSTFNGATGQAAVMADLVPIFYGAREVLAA